VSRLPRLPRPPMSDLTARTLRKAHAIARAYRELGEPLPAGIARLDRDYHAWRWRVRRGRQQP
jgi:hypothetical protein